MNAKVKFISAVLIFSTLGLFVKSTALPAGIIALARGGIGALFLLIVFVLSKKHFSKEMIKKNALLLVISGIVLGADWIFLFEAYKHTSVSIATVTYYLEPAMLVAFSALVLKEKLSWRKIVCISLALVGIVMVTGLCSGEALANSSLKGIAFGVAAAIAYAALTLINKFIKGLAPLESTLIQLAIATVVVAPYAFATADFSTLVFHSSDIMLLVILGIFHTGIAFWIYFSSVARLESQTIAVLGYVEPVVTIILSSLILHENMVLIQVLGTVLVLGSTLVSQIRPRIKEAC